MAGLVKFSRSVRDLVFSRIQAFGTREGIEFSSEVIVRDVKEVYFSAVGKSLDLTAYHLEFLAKKLTEEAASLRAEDQMMRLQEGREINGGSSAGDESPNGDQEV